MPIGVGLYGTNGHQIQSQVANNPATRLAAVAAWPAERIAALREHHDDFKVYASLPEMLADRRVDLVSLCSPCRAEQATETLLALNAGKHVYAEKPCAVSERDLDAILKTAARSEGLFHEMAGSAFSQPWLAIGDVVRSGQLGTIVQILAQKSYPMFSSRPQDESIDGGLTCQAGVHAYRWIEHVVGQRIATVHAAIETQQGNPVAHGELRVGSTSIMTLESGAIATVIANYCNQPGMGSWGNEMLRIFGTKGFVEATDGGTKTRLVIGETDHGPLDTSAPPHDYFDLFIDEILDRGDMPLSLEDELHPTRMVIRAKVAAR